jgi:hypothetical protein
MNAWYHRIRVGRHAARLRPVVTASMPEGAHAPARQKAAGHQPRTIVG